MKLLYGFGLGILACVLIIMFSGSSVLEESSIQKQHNIPDYTFPDIPKQLNFAGESVPMNDIEVEMRIQREMVSNCYFHSNTFLLIQRANRYFPIVEQILHQYEVPDDFKYLMVAESGMQNVVSPSGAVGFWQFMKNTGPDYGLSIDNQIDERYNWIESTYAAAQYILDLKERFGTWSQAAAAYNVGPNGFEKFQDKQLANSYWETLLPEETMRYVPRIVALKTILSNPEHYHFSLNKKQLQPEWNVQYEEVNTSNIKWAVYAESKGISYKTLKFYNPWLRQTDFVSSSPVTLSIALPNS